eukprot:760267-Hanusia_phi.AAC.3
MTNNPNIITLIDVTSPVVDTPPRPVPVDLPYAEAYPSSEIPTHDNRAPPPERGTSFPVVVPPPQVTCSSPISSVSPPHTSRAPSCCAFPGSLTVPSPSLPPSSPSPRLLHCSSRIPGSSYPFLALQPFEAVEADLELRGRRGPCNAAARSIDLLHQTGLLDLTTNRLSF